MKAEQFHRTPIGARVVASIGNSEHVASVKDKDTKKRKFLLRFNLASGEARNEWRSAGCCKRAPDEAVMGSTRGRRVKVR